MAVMCLNNTINTKLACNVKTKHKTANFNCKRALLNLKFHTFYISLSFKRCKTAQYR